jgi:CDGSH-type Zn-finger protein
MAAAEDQRAGAIETVDQRNRVTVCRCDEERQPGKQPEERD